MPKIIVDGNGKVLGKVEGDRLVFGDEELDKLVNEEPRRIVSGTTLDGTHYDIPEIVKNPTLEQKLSYVRIIGLFVKDTDEEESTKKTDVANIEESIDNGRLTCFCCGGDIWSGEHYCCAARMHYIRGDAGKDSDCLEYATSSLQVCRDCFREAASRVVDFSDLPIPLLPGEEEELYNFALHYAEKLTALELPDRSRDLCSFCAEEIRAGDHYTLLTIGEEKQEDHGDMNMPEYTYAVLCKDCSDWSDWFSIDDASLKQELPDGSGVYEIRTDFNIERVKGRSHIVTIGSAKDSLNKRVYQQRIENPARYLNRVEKWLKRQGHDLEVRYMCTNSGEKARYLEALLLFQYENKHWEIPPGNDKLEQSPIIATIDKKLGKRNLKNILSDSNKTTKQISEELNVPEYVVENLMVYNQIARKDV